LPVFFTIQFAFLYDGWKNNSLDLKSAFLFLVVGGFILAVSLGLLEEGALLGGIGLEGLFAGEGFAGFEGFETLVANVQDFFPFL
jgi:zeaxanthin epoxidase